MMRACCIFIVLLAPALVYAQRIREFPTGRIEVGQRAYALLDSVQIKGAGADTSRSVYIGGADILGLFARYDNRADSINITLFLDISYGDSTFVQWAPIDTAIVSGVTDSLTFKRISEAPNFAVNARLRVAGAMPATDSSRVTAVLIVTKNGGL